MKLVPMKNTLLSTILLILVYVFNYIGTTGQENLSGIFPFPYMPPGWTFGVAWGTIYL